MGEVVDLKLASLVDDQELIVDLCRFRENLLTEKFIRRKHRLDNTTWERLGSDEGNALVEKVEEESARRIRDGSAKRELAQKHIVRGPDILNGIMSDPHANARHRIDSCKVLNDFCNGPGDAAPASDRFLIQINLGSDSLVFNKSIRPLEPGEIDPDDSGPNDVDSMPHLAAIAAKKPTENGGGESL